MLIEQIRPDDLKPNPRNPRVNDAAVDAVARSIQAYGFTSPIITDPDLNIAAGHTRLKAARKLGLGTVPVIRVPGLTGSRFAGFTIADNKTAELADWDRDLLGTLVKELNLDAEFNLTNLGFSDKELTDLLDSGLGLEEKLDQAPECPETPITQPGDLYLLGEHRLLCGDATDGQHLARLMGAERLDAIVTDPPYGVAYLSRGKKREEWGGIENDDLDAAALEAFLAKSFSGLAGVCRPGAVAYVCHGISVAGIRIAFERAFVGAGFHLSSTIVWVKQAATMGWSDYRERHECLLYGWIGEGHRRIVDRTQTTVWDDHTSTKPKTAPKRRKGVPRSPETNVWYVDREGAYKHPTQKPVALISRALRNSTIRGERVGDPFCGSGSTLMACEQLGRRCYAMELEPKYCDVIVKRWEDYTGRQAERAGD